jgi:carbamoyl-phosphate synthase large subunit
VKKAEDLGFNLIATRGTALAVEDQVKIDIIRKVSQGSPNIRDAIMNGEVAMIINTPQVSSLLMMDTTFGEWLLNWAYPT